MRNFLFSLPTICVLSSLMFGVANAQPPVATAVPVKKVDESAPMMSVPRAAADDNTGYYIGLYGGYANRHITKNALFDTGGGFTVTGRRTGGFAGRVVLGYQYGPNFGVETGYTLLPHVKSDILTNIPEMPTANTSSTAYLFDFLFKGQMEFQYGIVPYAKIGIAYVHSVIRRPGSQDSNANDYRPAFALGLGYRITPNVTLNTEWYRVTGNSNGYNGFAQQRGGRYAALPLMDLFLTGINYRF
jgi:hypothetical protein